MMEYKVTETMIKRNRVILNANSGGLVRPLDAMNLMKLGAEWINNLYEHEKHRGSQPFIIDDIIIDLVNGAIIIYYYYQYDEDGTKIEDVWR